MNDLTEQLRECAKRQLAIAPSYIDKSLEWLAADEIERLQADNASLRAALQTQAEEAAKHNAWMSQVHGLCFDLGIAPGHIEDRLFEAIGRVNMLIEQRDELLGALKLAWGFIPVGMTETDAIIKAAITKATT